MCSIGNCSLENFGESDKCILHCKKDNWSEDKENKFSVALQKYINVSNYEITDIYFPSDSLPYYLTENKTFFFRRCHFKKGLNFYNYHKRLELYFDNCFFYDDIIFYNTTNIKSHFVNSCYLNQNSIIANSVTFTENIELSGITDIKKLNFNSSIFKGNVDFSYLTVYKESDFGFINCERTFSITDSTFKDRLILDKANFDNNIILSVNIKSKVIFDLSNTIIKNKSNFYKLKVTSLNRETARIIKDSFEQQNNIIEANKYYAIEMQKMEDELSWKDNFFDKLVFKAHGLTSNHSQDWFLASLWVIFFGMLLTVYKTDISTGVNIFFCIVPLLYKYLKKYMFIVFYSLYFLFINSINKHPLDDFASNINPFSIMTSADKLTFTELVFKIIIAFLIYQLIVSIRQNTRRK